VQTIFSTDEVHPRDRFQYWHEVACRHIVSHESQPQSRPTFQASLSAGRLGPVTLVLFRNSPMRAWRTQRHAATLEADELFVCSPLSGSLLLEQESGEACLEAGDLAIVDPALPYAGTFIGECETLVLKIPRPTLEARTGKGRAVVGRALKMARPEVGLASSFLAMLPDYAGQVGQASAEMLSEVIPDLLAAAIAGDPGSRTASTAHTRVLAALRVAVDTSLSNASLTGSEVAAIAGISVRYANAVLAREGTSLTRLLQQRRLERCRRALEDPQDKRSVGEIAFGWGFADLSHFGRRFKAAFGLTPSQYRKQARQARSGATA
jgi:AraC-like DNA-binding protein